MALTRRKLGSPSLRESAELELKRRRKAPLPALGATTDDKTEFFLTASHQLKSPVAIIQWCLQSVLELQDLPPEGRTLVGKALEQAGGMAHLMGDMLQVFRLIGHKVEHALEPVGINQLLEEILTQYELVAHNHGVHLVRGAIENLPDVIANTTLVRQALINLVDNAIKYTKSGGHVTVNVRATKAGMVEVSVQDEGIGIPETEQEHLFTEFFRGQEARDTVYEGTGLGLVLVKHIAEHFGGRVHFKSALHKGSTFIFEIPFNA